MSNTNRWRGAESNEMRSFIARHSRTDLERLLDGQLARHDALGQLLTAARTTPVVSEVAGMGAALAAFAGISQEPAIPVERSSSTMKTWAAKVMAAKLAVLGGAAMAATAGGVALAASTGHLPNLLPHSSNAAPAASAQVPASDDPSTSASTSTSSKPPHPSATPSPSLVGLCHSWLARPHINGSADTNPAFTVLVTAAGSSDAVDSYCTTLLASSTPSGEPGSTDHRTGKPSDIPSNTDHPTGKPSDIPSNTDHPTGKPSDIPSNTDHPTGKPTALPTHPTH
jgi:hypothetical protein